MVFFMYTLISFPSPQRFTNNHLQPLKHLLIRLTVEVPYLAPTNFPSPTNPPLPLLKSSNQHFLCLPCWPTLISTLSDFPSALPSVISMANSLYQATISRIGVPDQCLGVAPVSQSALRSISFSSQLSHLCLR